MACLLKTVSFRTILWLLPALLCFKDLQAQSYSAGVRKLSVEDGLSNRFTTSICKDSRGFMWIGTQYGLNRYDGYEFKLYTKENSALTTSAIREIYEDSGQQLWIIQRTNRGRVIDILDLQTGHIQNFNTIFKSLAPFNAEAIADIYADTGKTLWITTVSGKLYHYKNQRFQHIAAIPTSKQDRIAIYYANKGFVWISNASRRAGTSKRLTGVELKTGTTKTFDIATELLPTGMDDYRTLWLFHPEEQTFLKLDWAKQTVESAEAMPPEFPDFAASVTFARQRYLDNPGNFLWWISNPGSTREGFPTAWQLRENIRYDFRDAITPLLSYKGTPNISDACLDMENRLWVATNDGIFILSLKKNKFTTITSPDDESYSTMSIAEDNNGLIYIRTYGGELRFHPEKGVLGTSELSNGKAITKNQKGRLWFIKGKFWFNKGRSMVRYDPENEESLYYKRQLASGRALPGQRILMSDTRGQFWIGTLLGLYNLDTETGEFREFTRYNGFTGLKDSEIYHLQETGEGIWVSTSSGLYLIAPGKGVTVHYSREQPSPDYIPHNYILHFHRDSEGIFWLATQGGGLIRFDPGNGSVRQFTTTDGLSNNIIYAVYEDDYGKLWLSSSYGLMQFDKKSYRVNTWLKNDGIAHNEFNIRSHYQGADGRLYFGGLAGVTIFHPKDFITEAPVPAPIRMTSCQVLNTKTGALTDKMRVISDSGALVLSPSDKSLILNFTLLNYQNTEKNTYAYKIEGLDKNWHVISDNNLRLNNLPYGRYVLRIKGQGIGGEQSANTLSINLRMLKPFYLKNGFMLSCILVLALLIYVMFRWRLQRLEKAKRQLQKTVGQRTKEIQRQKDKIEQQAEALKALNTTQSRWFTNIAHELRTPLTLIAGPVRQLLKTASGKTKAELEYLELVEKNSGNLLKLVNQIMDVSRMESGQIKLQKKPVQLHDLVEVSVANFESFAHQKGVSLTHHIQACLVVLIDKERFQNIVFNLISNALKFTHADGKVTVSLAYTPGNDVTITVADTGDGIPGNDLSHIFERYYQASDPNQVNQGGAGIGLALALELARLHGGNIIVESQVGKGSVFTLLLPETLVVRTEQPSPSKQSAAPPKTLPELPKMQHENREDKPRILLVEDNPGMRMYIKSFMMSDYTLIEAADGLQALAYLKKNTPDLVISDIMMPRMDGITLAKTLKSDDRLKKLPFITLTARTGEAVRIETLRIGIDDYLTKPFNAEELQVRTANLIRNYKARQSDSIISMDEVSGSAHHEKLIDAMKAVVMEQLNNNTFSTHDLAASQHMSPSTLQRFLKKNTGLSPVQFIREIRLQYARKLLEDQQYPTLSEVIYASGFKHKSYFVKIFTARFGKKPSEYL